MNFLRVFLMSFFQLNLNSVCRERFVEYKNNSYTAWIHCENMDGDSESTFLVAVCYLFSDEKALLLLLLFTS